MSDWSTTKKCEGCGCLLQANYDPGVLLCFNCERERTVNMAEDIDWLKAVGRKSYDEINDSAAFLSLYTKNYKESPLCALQLGYAIMMNKPICLLVEKGEIVPQALRDIATTVDVFEPGDDASLKRAVERIAKFFVKGVEE